MSPFKSAYLDDQLKRWMRPDAHLFVRPDWRRDVRPGFEQDHPFVLYERKYRADQPRVPAGSREGGRWSSDEGEGIGGGGGGDDAEIPNNARPTQLKPDLRSRSSEQLIELGGEDLGSFGDGISVAKGPNISHQESFDSTSGVTTLSFTGIGAVVVDEKVGEAVYGSVYTVGTPARPDEGLSVTIDRIGKVRAYPSFGG